jgi:hypothetical protein
MLFSYAFHFEGVNSMFSPENGKKYLPPTGIASLMTTVIITSSGIAYLGVTGIYPLVVLAAGLWRLTVWARVLTVIILWFMLLILPIAAMNPINDADIMKSGDPAILTSTLLKLVPMMLASLWALHIFGRYRGEFRRKII